MPSRQAQEQILKNNVVHQSQIKELLEHRQTISEKISAAIERGGKIRLEDLLEDSSINVDNEDIEDQMRIICNNTGKSNFK